MDQLIPGVQQGQRLTLTGVSDRVSRVEEIVAKLAEDFYGTPAEPDPVMDSLKQRGEDALLAMKDARIKELEQTELSLREAYEDARRAEEYWHSEYVRVDGELEDIRSRLAGLI